MTKKYKIIEISKLFLALSIVFSAVLLISRPVSADFKSQVDTVTQSDEVESDRWEKDRREKDRDFGYQQGFENGKNGYGPNVDRDEIPVPSGMKNSDEYKNGYQEGYSKRWHQEHPLLGVVFDVFASIWDVVSGLFSEVS
ncbi:hypothetical protein ACUB69_000907 [Streptococcus pyogenes]|uniref:hypothetical protein n=1 Tax=Streptococcus pyogenes TaxID=1314 RepID=UPI000DA367E0|nr:hypothetical protein [Streptococcus pyogenes]HER4838140.1 hypothetical protein [Streptococcus pyogenes NGAS005]UEN78945.1 hypothetical protein H7798_01835 [Streptococcus pyogenes]WVM42118.1 hypothetical protein R3H61_07380 [Streptococcus pyogenes]SQF59050.1 hypothetical membrane associated protein [Streptococcus pyogenes]HEP1513266.1 hypothetical protein [Streptococcus pyogenes]